MESRVAVLQQIARTTATTLDRIERRQDVLARELRVERRADFRWLLGIMLGGFTMMPGLPGALLGVMAHGFHWL